MGGKGSKMAGKTIAVIGANGAQGGSVARALLEDGIFKVRCLVRNTESEGAKELKAKGAEIVKADSFDASSMVSAMEGCHGLFIVTFYWAHLSCEKETEEIKNATDAAKKAGVHHVIFSTLPDTRSAEFAEFYKTVPAIPDHPADYRVPHFDNKAGAEHMLEGIPIVSRVFAGAYYSNLINFGFLMRNEMTGGKLAYGTCQKPDGIYPGVAMEEDFGKVVAGMFKKGDKANGEYVLGFSEVLTNSEVIKQLSEVVGEEVVDAMMPADDFRKLPIPGAEDLANMFLLFGHPNFKAHVDAHIGKTKEYLPKPTTFKEWAEKNKEKLSLK